MNAPEIPDELVTFIEVLQEDGDLRAWFDSYGDSPEWQRADEFRRLAMRMHAGGEHPDLVRATALLAEPDIYASVVATLQTRLR